MRWVSNWSFVVHIKKCSLLDGTDYPLVKWWHISRASGSYSSIWIFHVLVTHLVWQLDHRRWSWLNGLFLASFSCHSSLPLRTFPLTSHPSFIFALLCLYYPNYSSVDRHQVADHCMPASPTSITLQTLLLFTFTAVIHAQVYWPEDWSQTGQRLPGNLWSAGKTYALDSGGWGLLTIIIWNH